MAEQTLAASKIDPTLLIFELTETAAIANIEQAKHFITRLRDFGCGFALDDFGAGFGSFHYVFIWRAMNALTISRARSVCGPGCATHSCSLPSNTWYAQSPPAAL